MGGIEPAEDWIRRALSAGKSVVTANKQMIARSGTDLIALARADETADPVWRIGSGRRAGDFRACMRDLAGDELFKIRGILNGTCNYILSQIETNGIPSPPLCAKRKS